MMSVRARLAGVLARWALVERKRPDVATSRLALRCHWVDCDINRHMNNSRYLALMDVGRWHLLLVSGMGREMMRLKWAPVAVHVEIDFKKSLHPGERFTLESYTAAVGNKSATVAQRFWVGDTLAADARVVVVFRGKDGTQPVAPLLEALPDVRAALESKMGASEEAPVPAATG